MLSVKRDCTNHPKSRTRFENRIGTRSHSFSNSRRSTARRHRSPCTQLCSELIPDCWNKLGSKLLAARSFQIRYNRELPVEELAESSGSASASRWPRSDRSSQLFVFGPTASCSAKAQRKTSKRQ